MEEIQQPPVIAPRGNPFGRNLLVFAGAAIFLAALIVWCIRALNAPAAMTTPFQAVLLSNGAAYYGPLEGLGTAFPVLKEVYYVQSRQNPDTKQTMNILVSRRKELHGPDRMILNSNMIVFIEPVDPSSRVAQLIAEAKNR
jgi:hypothetical protein